MLRYAITSRANFPGDESTYQAALIEQADRLAASGLDFLQLREKDLDAGTLANLARRLLIALRSRSPAARLLINSRVDVAIVTGADGVHLTSAPGSLSPAQVRQLYATASLPEPVISVSCHTLAEVVRARSSAATLILFGPVFEKRVTGQLILPGTGVELLAAACAAAMPTPVLALGGVDRSNTAACLVAGAAGVAAIRLFAERI